MVSVVWAAVLSVGDGCYVHGVDAAGGGMKLVLPGECRFMRVANRRTLQAATDL